MKKNLKKLSIYIFVLINMLCIPVNAALEYDTVNPAITSFLMIEPVLKNDEIINQSKLPEKEDIIYEENQISVNAINPKKQDYPNNYYPGFRGPNQLIIYTPKYGIRTGTNEFGTEVIVENGMVVSLNGADSAIPFNGFVISGHGRAKNWIMQNLQVGTKVYIDTSNKILKCFLTPESLLFAAKEKIKEVTSLLDYYRQSDMLYNDKKANEYLNSSKKLLQKAENDPEHTQTYINEAMTSLDEAIKNAIPYFKSELKGVWLRPVENTPEKIEKTVEKLFNTGITDIFLETYYHGKTIYNSEFLKKYGVTSQREEFIGFDPLEVWIKEAHKRKMKVHIWFECFYIGNDNPKLNSNHILSMYPSWANKRYSNYDCPEPMPSLSEHNGYFLDPANYEVQQFLYGIVHEMVTHYKVDGINLDYIRYPQSVDAVYPNYVSTNWGYTKAARDEFKLIYGVDPVEIRYGTIDWELWSLYRQNKISDFVKNIKQITKPYDVTVTAVIFPDLTKSTETKMQNWKLWSARNYVDGFTPLILTGDKNTAVTLLQEVTNNTGQATKIYPGIFVTFMGGTFEDLLFQIHKTREFKSKGAILFDYAHLGENYLDALKTRVYNCAYDEKKVCQRSSNKDYKPQVRYKDRCKKSGRKNKCQQ